MIRKKLFACFTTEFTYLQKMEIEKGKKAGLNDAQVRLFAFTEFNHLQMKEIRLAIEDGIEEGKLKCMCHSSIPFQWMHLMRLQMNQGKKVTDLHLKKQMIAFLSILNVAVLLYFYVPFYQEPFLTLKQSSIRLAVGEAFQPMDYIADYSRGKGRLILPEMIDTSKEGDQIAVYRLMSQDTLIEKVLYVSVCTDTE